MSSNQHREPVKLEREVNFPIYKSVFIIGIASSSVCTSILTIKVLLFSIAFID